MNFVVVIATTGALLCSNVEAVGISRLNNTAVTKPKSKRRNDDAILKRLLQNNQKLTELLQQRSAEPVIWNRRAKILTGKTFKGITLNAINSTNLSSPILVQALPNQGLPYPTKFACQGVTQNKRVFTLCNLMISDEKETPISAQVLNIDGSSGLEGEYDDAKEALIAGAVASEFAAGMMSAAQARISGPLGGITDSTLSNQLLQGAVNSGRTTSEILLEEMKTKEPIVSVDAGIEVLIYFMEAPNEV